MKLDSRNERFEMAADLVNGSSRSIFLTGKAGTGKTTFLKFIRENSPKQHVVVAPTGVAAMNAGGVTIHSFFQLPLVPFVPGRFAGGTGEPAVVDEHTLVSRLRFNREKIQLLRELELLIIDEVSMVRCDILDAIDVVLRHVRRRMEPFGGVQLLMIGDMFQLPPVSREEVWQWLKPHYASPYFFDSQVMTTRPPLYIEFEKIYRQSDDRFIGVLNQIRHNTMDASGMEILESRYQPGFETGDDDGYIVLTTHNEMARRINAKQLDHLPGLVSVYEATVEKDFPENSYPAESTLRLKKGAQVMFIRNDMDKAKRFFNGRLGEIVNLEKDKIEVLCRGDQAPITIGREKWENIRYSIDNKTREIGQDVLGSFSQYPLRLAWAITIHKSQGLTFDKAVVDAGNAFAPGQVYVALSRCTSLDGLILKSRITTASLAIDPRIVAFSDGAPDIKRLEAELAEARKSYQENLLIKTFDFHECVGLSRDLATYVKEHQSAFNDELLPWTESLSLSISAIQDTASRFHGWIRDQFVLSRSNGDHAALNERIPRAGIHFIKEITKVMSVISAAPAVTDNKLHAKEFNEYSRELFIALGFRKHMIDWLKAVPDPMQWHSRRNTFAAPALSINAYGGQGEPQSRGPHPELHSRLRKLRNELSQTHDVAVYMIISSKAIDEMAIYLPHDRDELLQISGFGKTKVSRFGDQFLDIIRAYCEANGLVSEIQYKPGSTRKTAKDSQERPAKKIGTRSESTVQKQNKPGTRQQTLQLFKEGNRPETIAGIRNLALSTIEQHLTFYIASGDIDVSELVSFDRQEEILKASREATSPGLSAIKERINPDISYGEIRYVLTSQKGTTMDADNS